MAGMFLASRWEAETRVARDLGSLVPDLQSRNGGQISYLELGKSGTPEWREICMSKEALLVSVHKCASLE